MTRRVRLLDELRRVRPDVDDPVQAVAAGRVRVEGVVVTNPRSMVRRGAAIVVVAPEELRGSIKLRAALEGFAVWCEGRVCLDVGAAAGGFTTVLLERGAVRVYAVDVGHGQLKGTLRQDPRVVNLERTNVADLNVETVPESVGLVVVDVAYLSLASAVSQLARVEFALGADLVGLVKPMFELGLPSAPTDRASLDEALARAVGGVRAAGWSIVDTMDSPVSGSKGALELFLHARRPGAPTSG